MKYFSYAKASFNTKATDGAKIKVDSEDVLLSSGLTLGF